jgi:molybdate transport system substrate-binding protein
MPFIAALIAALALSACSADAASQDRVVRAAVASDLRFAFPEIIELVQEEHPDIDVRVTYGSSGQFMTQILNGAPFDLYLSADQAYPATVVDEGLASEGQLFRYARGRLVVWDPQGTLATPTIDDARNANTIAVANPRHAPYGRAAMEALTSSGLLSVVEDRLVFGENVSQTAEFAQSGAADIALIALSLVISGPLANTGTWTEIPQDLFEPLDQGGVVLDEAQDFTAAQSVRDVLLSPRGQEILARYGFED